MSSFRNTEQRIGVSGVGGSFIGYSVYPESHTHSGAGLVNVASGAGILGGVIPFIHSGGASDALSGAVIRVTDAISGIVTLVTKVLYNHDFGSFSGVQQGTLELGFRAPAQVGMGVMFKSGLNIQGVPDYGVTVYYSKENP